MLLVFKTKDMVKQSKNKVKLSKKYKAIGRIPMTALKKIKEVMDLPENVQIIRANMGNTIKHNIGHIKDIDEQLQKLGLTKEDYAEFVTRNYNEIHQGNKPFSLILAVTRIGDHDHIAAVHLNYDKNENFWLVTTVHSIKPHDLNKMPLIWRK